MWTDFHRLFNRSYPLGGSPWQRLSGQRPPLAKTPPTETSPWTERPLDKDHPRQRPPWTKTPPGQRPPWTETPPDRDPRTETLPLDTSGRYASYWNSFLFYICIQWIVAWHFISSRSICLTVFTYVKRWMWHYCWISFFFKSHSSEENSIKSHLRNAFYLLGQLILLLMKSYVNKQVLV